MNIFSLPLVELKSILDNSRKSSFICSICNKPVDDYWTGSYFVPVKLMMMHVAEFKCHGQVDRQENALDGRFARPFAEIAALRKSAYLV